MTAPAIGDVVRIGDLPAGAWCKPVAGDLMLVCAPSTVEHHTLVANRGGMVPDEILVTVVSLPAVPPTESEAVAAWHARATEAQAALARVTAERDEATGLARRTEAQRDEWRGVALAVADALGAVTRDEDGRVVFVGATGAEMAERIRELTRQRDEIDARHRGLLGEGYASPERAERLMVNAAKHATLADAVVRAFADGKGYGDDALALLGAQFAADPDPLATLTAQVRWERERNAVATICEALGMGEADDRTPAGAAKRAAEMRAEVARLNGIITDACDRFDATLATRDAQEGDRIAAWVERTGRLACNRCWYPSDAVLSGIDAIDDETRRAVVLCVECLDDERASAEEGDDG